MEKGKTPRLSTVHAVAHCVSSHRHSMQSSQKNTGSHTGSSREKDASALPADASAQDLHVDLEANRTPTRTEAAHKWFSQFSMKTRVASAAVFAAIVIFVFGYIMSHNRNPPLLPPMSKPALTDTPESVLQYYYHIHGFSENGKYWFDLSTNFGDSNCFRFKLEEGAIIPNTDQFRNAKNILPNTKLHPRDMPFAELLDKLKQAPFLVTNQYVIFSAIEQLQDKLKADPLDVMSIIDLFDLPQPAKEISNPYINMLKDCLALNGESSGTPHRNLNKGTRPKLGSPAVQLYNLFSQNHLLKSIRMLFLYACTKYDTGYKITPANLAYSYTSKWFSYSNYGRLGGDYLSFTQMFLAEMVYALSHVRSQELFKEYDFPVVTLLFIALKCNQSSGISSGYNVKEVFSDYTCNIWDEVTFNDIVVYLKKKLSNGPIRHIMKQYPLVALNK